MAPGELRRAGLKVTIPRLRILELLEQGQGRHMSAEEVYHDLHAGGEDIGLATVYRVLTQFEQVGLVKRHHFEGSSAVFELNQGPHHDHIVCIQCGRVDEFMDATIEEQQRQVAQRLGYAMTGHSLHIYGVCASCTTKEDQERPAEPSDDS